MSGAGPTTARDIVLVVDDSPGTLGLLTDALEEAGYTVLVATDGAGAVALVGRVTPDIILMDALMPGLNGFETCARIKRHHAMADVPVIFMTGLKDTESVVRGLAAGGVDYVTKPAVPEEIIARIRVHLETARRARDARIALDTAGRFLLAATAGGDIRWCTPQAARLLFGEGASGASRLPDAACAWLTAHIAGTAKDAAEAIVPGTPMGPLAIAGPRGALELSFVVRVGAGEFLLRLAEVRGAEAQSAAEAFRLKARLGVTAREAEVLLWLARGKQNRDIADILGLSPRTVNKHLEQAYAKLGIENRTAAVAMAMRALGGE